MVVFKYNTNGVNQWTKQLALFNTTASDLLPGIDVDLSGNVYICYETTGTVSGGVASGSSDIVVFKLDTNGTHLWNRQQAVFNTTGLDGSPDIAVDTSGNVYVAYHTSGTVSGGTFGGVRSIVVFKLDTNGTHLWNRESLEFNTFGGTDLYPAIDVDPSGNVYVVYQTTGTVSGGTKLGVATNNVVFKLNTNGVFQWSRQEAVFNTSAGTSQYPSISVDASGNSYIAYDTTGTVSGGVNSGSNDIVVFKIDTNGTFQWSRQQSVFNTNQFDLNSDIAADSIGNVYVTYRGIGTVSGGVASGSNDVIVFKLDTNGTHQWNQQSAIYNTTATDGDSVITVNSSREVYVAFTTGGTVSGGVNKGSIDIAVLKLAPTAGTGTLAIGTSGVTGTILSAYAPIAANPYVGLTFRCLVVPVTLANTLSISGTNNVASNGITPIGNTAANLTPRELIFVNTGTNTWNMLIK